MHRGFASIIRFFAPAPRIFAVGQDATFGHSMCADSTPSSIALVESLSSRRLACGFALAGQSENTLRGTSRRGGQRDLENGRPQKCLKVCLDTLLAKNIEGEANNYSNRLEFKNYAPSSLRIFHTRHPLTIAQKVLASLNQFIA
jgi:hypothetical protein